jgi:hypothetical protein
MAALRRPGQLAVLGLLLLGTRVVWAENTPQQTLIDLHPVFVTVPPTIDGALDDEAWKGGPAVDDVFVTYDPVDGNRLPQATAVYLAYDHDNLYFAFHCRDTDPEGIKTTITKRDNLWRDDWVGLSLDTINGKQFAYDLFVNPSGMQGDIYRSGNGQDTSTDWVWYSAGSIVDDGYVVEMRIPLKSFRFNAGEDVQMGVLFWRRISRLGVSGAWPEIGIGKGVFNSMAKVVYGRLDKQLQLEVLPSVTSSALWDRQTPASWGAADRGTDMGIGVKYGLTSSIGVEGTVNPDFSQVESDTFQVETNQRYPVFYDEKRPFFMESGHQFELAGTSGDSNMRTAVHTRRIVDPRWGAKLTGEAGKTSFAFLGASDQWAGRTPGEDEDPNPHLGQDASFMLGRARAGMGGDNYVGLLYTGRELPGDHNRVLGGDFRFRIHGKHEVLGNFLHSASLDVDSPSGRNGNAFTAMYQYFDKPFGCFFQVENMDEGFRMDTAYFERTGMRRMTAYVGPQLYPQSPRWSWVKRVNPFFFGFQIHDHVTGKDDAFGLLALRFDLTRQGQLRVDYRKHREYWQGQAYDQSSFFARGSAQVVKWLNLGFYGWTGRSLYYDEDDPFLGRGSRANVAATVEPSDKLSLSVDYTYEYLDRPEGTREYDLHLIVSRLTYQFNKYFFLRALVQSDSNRGVVLSDVLASVTVIPGTVFHVGYGSLHQKNSWAGDRWNDDATLGRYHLMRKSFFVKGSYLFRF